MAVNTTEPLNQILIEHDELLKDLDDSDTSQTPQATCTSSQTLTNDLFTKDPNSWFDDIELAGILKSIEDKPTSHEPEPQKYESRKFQSPNEMMEINPASHLDQFDWIFEKYKSKEKLQESTITDKQLRALNRKHLIGMLRDSEKELRQLKKENEILMLAYQALIKQTQ